MVLDTLQRLAAQNNPGAQDVLCRLVIEHNHPRARQIVVAEQCAPRDPHQRALLYFLTEQWEYYEHLDFDQNLLKAIYPLTAPDVRKRLAECARRGGRLEWVNSVAGDRQRKHLGTMTDNEWETTLSVLSEHQSYREMWQLAQVAPAVRSAQLLCRLKEVAWKPQYNVEHTAFTELTEKAKHCQKESTHALSRLKDCYMEFDDVVLPSVTCLAISPDSRLLASGSRTVRLWSLPDGAALQTLEGHTGRATCLAISFDNRLLASGSDWGHTGRLWSLPDGEVLQTLEGCAECLAISPGGRILVSGGNDKTVGLWGLPDGTRLQTLEMPSVMGSRLQKTLKMSPVMGSHFTISPDGRILVSSAGDMWNLGREQVHRLSRLPLNQTHQGDIHWVQETLHTENVTHAERTWLEFILALMRWYRRYDIELDEAPKSIPAREFDIEIEVYAHHHP